MNNFDQNKKLYNFAILILLKVLMSTHTQTKKNKKNKKEKKKKKKKKKKNLLKVGIMIQKFMSPNSLD